VSASKCAICGKPQEPKFKPFCSKRCADVDLNRWLSGGYRIGAEEERKPDTAGQDKRDEDEPA